MARPKEFDPDLAVDAAVGVFWRRGYEATSVQDLVDALGVGRGSLYATFGSKEELYRRALERYLAVGLCRLEEHLAQAGSPLAAVRDLLRAEVESALADADRRGCLAAGAVCERVAYDEATSATVVRGWERMEDAVCDALRRAQTEGELPAGRDPRALARYVVAARQGLRLLGTGRPDRAVLTDALEVALVPLA